MSLKDQILAALNQLQGPSSILEEVSHMNAQELEPWIKVIDESPFSLPEWCKALMQFKSWEESEGRFLTLAHKLEYLSCCTEGGASARNLVSLTDLLNDYLKNHGVE